MPQKLKIEEFLVKAEKLPVLDVRSPSEYRDGHVCGAFSLPLFTDEERAIVGTTYNHQGREAAILRGLKISGPKLNRYYHQLRKISPSDEILMYCWRGGMRSASLAWLFELFGKKVYLLEKGYKAYRRAALETFDKPLHLIVLSGMTGSGKTELLKRLKEKNQQVIDLESLAHHRGSAFGHLGEDEQPTTQQFENQLFEIIRKFDCQKNIWIEDESRNIGKVILPQRLWEQMRQSPMIEISVDVDIRIKRICEEYGKYSPDELCQAVEKIREKLGSDRTESCFRLIHENKLEEAVKILLEYYDKRYLYGIRQRKNISRLRLEVSDSDEEKIVEKLIEASRKIINLQAES